DAGRVVDRAIADRVARARCADPEVVEVRRVDDRLRRIAREQADHVSGLERPRGLRQMQPGPRSGPLPEPITLAEIDVDDRQRWQVVRVVSLAIDEIALQQRPGPACLISGVASTISAMAPA